MILELESPKFQLCKGLNKEAEKLNAGQAELKAERKAAEDKAYLKSQQNLVFFIKNQ